MNFKKVFNELNNPYDGGNSSSKIVNILEEINLKNILKKVFDIKFSL